MGALQQVRKEPGGKQLSGKRGTEGEKKGGGAVSGKTHKATLQIISNVNATVLGYI